MKLWFTPKNVTNQIKKINIMDTKPEENIQMTEADTQVPSQQESIEAKIEVAPKIVEPKFKVISIDKTEAPSGMSGDNWYRYVIGQGTSKIEGLTMGDLINVTAHAEAIAFDLNGRSKGGNAAHKSGKSKATPPNIPAPAVKS